MADIRLKVDVVADDPIEAAKIKAYLDALIGESIPSLESVTQDGLNLHAETVIIPDWVPPETTPPPA